MAIEAGVFVVVIIAVGVWAIAGGVIGVILGYGRLYDILYVNKVTIAVLRELAEENGGHVINKRGLFSRYAVYSIGGQKIYAKGNVDKHPENAYQVITAERVF